ncbi:hypothetical protein F0U61_08025 [Archangium violaceum]|uniref:hypothetical protein n=1 Tax=Archangium violaceum TaxID=83451 RepID=UPI002B2F95C7|nr:hypothetical protein F0U61_08025 [Archangium violaceum]
MKRGVVNRATRTCVLTGAVLLPVAAWAGNHNLSYPVVLPEGAGLSLRMGLTAPRLEGRWWYGWMEGQEPVACAPSTCTPPPGVDVWRVYPQEEGGHWQAGVLNGTPGATVGVSEVDWSDGLENTTWSTASTIRVETTLYTALDEPLPAYEMQHLHGQGVREMRGVVASNTEPAIASRTESGDATVITPCARLTIQKLESSASAQRPQPERFHWNAVTGEWNGAAYTLVNSAVWEKGDRGRSGGLAAVVDVSGKALFRYDWELWRAALPMHVSSAGWYRLTFSLDGSAAGGKRCGGYALNTSIAEAEVEVGEQYPSVVDAVWNLSYVDIYVRQKD